MESVKIIECTRDAWQGLPKVIPTEVKVAYLRRLIEAGFRHIDVVSFVAPKYVPQMADSESVMQNLGRRGERSASNAESVLAAVALPKAADPQGSAPAVEIIGIVVNERGLERALATPGVTTIGYPHSMSATFLRQNANRSAEESRALVERMKQAVRVPGAKGRDLVVYLSMAFGNPYGEPWEPEMVTETVNWLKRIGVRTVSLADTVGKAQPEDVGKLFSIVRKYADDPDGMEIGLHLHSRPEGAAEKVLAAYEAGCRRFDSALTGLGGCPFAGDELVGNIPTEIVVAALSARGVAVGIEPWAMLSAAEATKEIRRQYAQ